MEMDVVTQGLNSNISWLYFTTVWMGTIGVQVKDGLVESQSEIGNGWKALVVLMAASMEKYVP